MGREQNDGVQVQEPISNRGEQLRESSRGSCRTDSLQSRVLGHSEFLDTVGVHRGIPAWKEQLTGLDLGNVSQQKRGARSFLRKALFQLMEQIGVGHVRKRVTRHGSLGGGGSPEADKFFVSRSIHASYRNTRVAVAARRDPGTEVTSALCRAHALSPLERNGESAAPTIPRARENASSQFACRGR